ncbi:hypothetical protein [Microvirga guangxiensis]|nr:hypothetical protein [Microvirga guangxiensis]
MLHAALIIAIASTPELASAENQNPPGLLSAPTPVKLQLEPVSKPVQMVRTLQLMQDQIAVGSTEAHLGQRGLLAILDNRFMALETEFWADARNVRAAIAFVLSGGNPQILRKLLEIGVPLDQRAFVEGTLAYVEGREEEAKNKLLSLDVKTLAPMLGAQLALVQSALIVRTDAKKSSDLLDFVRLQAPGTLLEEGALRRQVFVASQTGDMKKFLALSSDYLRRYRHSVYAGNFRQRLASALTRIDFGKDERLFSDVVEMLKDLESDARLDLYLLVARSSIDQGFTKSARMLSEKARELARADAVSAERAKLYLAASMIVSPETVGAAEAELQSVNKSLLPESDAALLSSALSMAGHIRQMPGDKTAEKRANPSSDALAVEAASDGGQAPEQLQTVLKARDTLSRIDQLIKNQAPTVR